MAEDARLSLNFCFFGVTFLDNLRDDRGRQETLRTQRTRNAFVSEAAQLTAALRAAIPCSHCRSERMHHCAAQLRRSLSQPGHCLRAVLACHAVRHDGSTDFRAPWSAHAWTIGPNFWHELARRTAPAAEPWSTTLHDAQAGAVTLHGALRREAGTRGRSCLVIVHGLGGSFDRHYCTTAALAAQHAGLSCLRFGLRGADRQGQDFYHGGLWADVHAAVSSEALADFEALYVLGYSLGGHVSLRYALEEPAPRVRAVAAVCAPLDLELSARHIDAPRSYVYRRHVLAGLNQIYAAVARRRSVPTPLPRVCSAHSLRTWDSLTVVPRFGFDGVADYYASMSVGPQLARLRVPSLLVQSTLDPMVPPWTYERHLARPAPRLQVRRVAAGGHVAFPHVADAAGRRGSLELQILEWLTRDAARA